MEIEFNPNEKLKKYYIDKYNQYIFDNNLRLKFSLKKIFLKVSYYSNFSNQNKETFPRKEIESLNSNYMVKDALIENKKLK